MGKMILLVVLGSYFILGSFMRNNNNISTDAVTNVINYYVMSNTKHIAISGANLAVSNIYRNKAYRDKIKDLDFMGGTINTNVIDDPTLGKYGVRVFSIGKYMDQVDTVIVNMRVTTFSDFLYFADEFGAGYFVTGDTISGPFHTNTKLNVSGKPVFLGKVTMRNGPEKRSNWYATADPQFLGGISYGEYHEMPTDLGEIGSKAKTGGFYSKDELWVTFNNNNTITFKTSEAGPDSTAPLSVLAPNGLFYSEKELHIKGKISGQLTIASKKDIWIDDDVGVVDDPKTNPFSTEMLGICTERDVIITNNVPNSNNVNITAAIFTGKSLYAEDYNSRPNSGYINLFGSLTQQKAGYTGAGSSGGKVKYGFNENHVYDPRFFISQPPEFPTSDRMKILAWWE